MSGPVRRTVGVCNARGLHARASAKFVKLASSFESEIRVSRDGQTVDARSIMGLLMLSAANGCAVEIVNERGLHARASAKFVKAAAQFQARVTVSRDGQTVDAQSIMGLMMLGAGPGSVLDIVAEGPDAEDALATLERLIQDRFDEER